MEKEKATELLAPAGSPAAFYGAVNAGADAVYLAGSRFGARAYADNFTMEELVECIRYGHLLGRKIYLAVNTLLKERELEELYGDIRPLYDAGLDAAIVQDFGVFRCLKEAFPGLKLHASTQMTICGSDGARLLKDMGASRIVPARELSLRELRKIRRQVDVELETFVHGAMCYCYSGQCLFSSILGGRSGNRGRCAQPCRLPYTPVTDGIKGREGYYLSLKDLCTIEHIPELMSAGIDSFKIEGRMKKPEYAAGVTAIYRKYMDHYLELRARFGEEEAGRRFRVEREDSSTLKKLYIRSDAQDGYYFRHNGRDMVTLSNPAYGGSDEDVLESVRAEYLAERKRLPVRMEAFFAEGEAARVTLRRGETAVTVRGDRVERAARQPITEENVRRQLGKLGDSAFCAAEGDISVVLSPNAFYPLRQINELRRQAVGQLEEALLARNLFRQGGSPAPESARRRDVGEQDLFRQGGSPAPESARRRNGGERDFFRQDGSPAPESARRRDVGEQDFLRQGCSPARDGRAATGFSVSVATLAQLRALQGWMACHPEHPIALLYVNGDLLSDARESVLAVCEELAEKCPLFLALPYILREGDSAYLEELAALAGKDRLFSGFLIRSADGLGYFRHRGKECALHLDAGVYVWNSRAVAQLGEGIDSLCLPFELNRSEQLQLLESVSGFPHAPAFEKVVYGRIPMMITANCVLRTAKGCAKEDFAVTALTDRYKKTFPVVRSCRHCLNIIYNSVPLSLPQECGKWRQRLRLRLDFTVEDGDGTGRILDVFLAGKEPGQTERTAGHERRGVE